MRNKIVWLLSMAVLALPLIAAEEPAEKAKPAVEETATPEQASEIAELRGQILLLQQRLEKLEAERQQEAMVVTVEEAQQEKEQLEKLEQARRDTNQRLLQVERETGLDRVRFSGDYRFEAHSIDGRTPAHFDGMHLQNLMVNTLFYANSTGAFPQDLAQVDGFIAGNYSDYQFFTDNLTFEQLRQTVGSFPAAQQQQLFQFLMPSTAVGQAQADNDILYTNRLRLQMDARVGENVSFTGRLAMYKVFGDSTGVQVFNGQPTSVSVDGATVGVPNSDILRVERAFFTWNNIGGHPLYLSIGRRPSTGGAPLNYRHDEPRGGTPAGSLIDYQFDGITAGYRINDRSIFRVCYGLGYESGFGSGDLLQLPQDRLNDTHFLGINWDLWQTDRMFLQATVARAFDVTDGFNGLVVLPNNPVTGGAIGAPLIMRFTPSSNLGAINLGSVVFTRRDGPFDWFVSANYQRSDPENVTTPFGGLFSDPFETPEARNGAMFYVGARWTDPSEKTKLGFEFNRGSKYWFNFALAEDDIVAPKTATRGNVYETYLTHRLRSRFLFKVDYIHYDYDYSGSGWHLGAPKRLDSMPLLGFPTYDRVNKVGLSLIARF